MKKDLEQFMINAAVAEAATVHEIAGKIHTLAVSLVLDLRHNPGGVGGCFLGEGIEILLVNGVTREEIVQCVHKILDEVAKQPIKRVYAIDEIEKGKRE